MLIKKFAWLIFSIILLVCVPAFAIQLEGTITDINKHVPSITLVKKTGSAITVVLTDNTDILYGIRRIELSSLMPGYIIVVRYRVKEGKNIARYVGLVTKNLPRRGRTLAKYKK